MSAILTGEPGTSAQCEENHVSTSTTTQQNVFTVRQIQPQAIFAGVHIDKFDLSIQHLPEILNVMQRMLLQNVLRLYDTEDVKTALL